MKRDVDILKDLIKKILSAAGGSGTIIDIVEETGGDTIVQEGAMSAGF